jgi:hypothetical protein
MRAARGSDGVEAQGGLAVGLDGSAVVDDELAGKDVAAGCLGGRDQSEKQSYRDC